MLTQDLSLQQNLCYQSIKDGLQIGVKCPGLVTNLSQDCKGMRALKIVCFYFSVKEEQKPVQTSPHSGFQKRLGRTVAWRYNDLLTENTGKNNILQSGCIIMLSKNMSLEWLEKCKGSTRMNCKLPLEANVQIIFI